MSLPHWSSPRWGVLRWLHLALGLLRRCSERCECPQGYCFWLDAALMEVELLLFLGRSGSLRLGLL